MLLLLWLGLEL